MEYRSKNVGERKIQILKTVGTILKFFGWICFGFALVSTLIMAAMPINLSDGTSLNALQKAGLIFACDLIYLGIGAVCWFPGRQLIRRARLMQREWELSRAEKEHPAVCILCPNCGARITAKKGAASFCEYCGCCVRA